MKKSLSLSILSLLILAGCSPMEPTKDLTHDKLFPSSLHNDKDYTGGKTFKIVENSTKRACGPQELQ